MSKQRIRRSIQKLEADYNAGNRLPLETVVRAFKGIQELEPDDEDSFFTIAGYHGVPFRKHDWPDHDETDYEPPQYWGGYCNHANVLFPTWHRAYLLRLENAMRKVPGCEDVTIPFWDECFDTVTPVPKILTSPTFTLDGKTINNPLYSYRLQADLKDRAGKEHPQTKLKGYTTCRFPFSGLVGTPKDEEASARWNAKFTNAEKNVKILNGNVSNWLEGKIRIKDPKDGTKLPDDMSAVIRRFKTCLDAPNYTVFSNTESAKAYNLEKPKTQAVSLESPHNSIHLALGGFFQKGIYKANPEDFLGANGDMGENETASMDPIFHLHHAYVDYVFWRWQVKHRATKRGSLKVIKYYAGSNSGPFALPNVAPYTHLTPQTPLYPFKKPKGGPGSWYTSDDVTDIETDLGYTYDTGTMDQFSSAESDLLSEPESEPPLQVIRAHGINRAQIKGSFVVRTYAKVPNGNNEEVEIEIGKEAILSRWDVDRCANCQVTLPVESLTSLPVELVSVLDPNNEGLKPESFDVKVQMHSGLTRGLMASLAAGATHEESSLSAPQGLDLPKIEIL